MITGRKRNSSLIPLIAVCLIPVAFCQEPAAPAPETSAPAQTESAPAAAIKTRTYVKDAKGKLIWVGPNNVIELAPTPLLDEEGKQRLAPDGTPMFNKPVLQQRDKRGHPLFDEKGNPVFQTTANLGYDDKGKKLIAKKEKPVKTIHVAVAHGTLTVDGMIGKAALNYDIADFKYVYLYAPWVGTVVVSNVNFPGATLQPNVFEDKTMTVAVGEHKFQVYSDKSLLGKKPLPGFVMVDRKFQLPSQMPVMGYGDTIRQPYAWPGAKMVASTKIAPPVPSELMPTIALPPCPAGQMRLPVLPGEKRDSPCVPIGSKPVAAPAEAKPAAAPPPV